MCNTDMMMMRHVRRLEPVSRLSRHPSFPDTTFRDTTLQSAKT